MLAASDIEGKEEVLESLAETFHRTWSTWTRRRSGAALSSARLRGVVPGSFASAQPQTFLIAPSISVRVVAIESSTPVNTGG